MSATARTSFRQLVDQITILEIRTDEMADRNGVGRADA
jgi:hypothetical protein